ncbi:MAG: ATP-binding protein [Rubrivivax sp.]
MSTLGRWLDAKVTGAYVFGASRVGKTRAVTLFLKRLLEDRLGVSIPLHIWSRPFMHNSAAEFYKSLLSAFNHASGGTRAGPNDRLVILREFLISSANECGTNGVVLIVDEAHGMTTQEWLWLLALQNAMDSEGYALSVFLIASHQMAYEFDLMSRTGNPHVAARFLVDQWRYPGVESREELEFILDGYDVQSKWPRNEGVSYLEYFAPKDYASGRLLAHSAGALWDTMVALLPPESKGNHSFPMKHVALAVEDALFQIAFGADWEVATSDESWVLALTKHRFADHMRAISLDI